MKAVIYARYSSANQREASIEDQIRVCRAHIDGQGWDYVTAYRDQAISGATLLRPGYQQLHDGVVVLRHDVLSEAGGGEE